MRVFVRNMRGKPLMPCSNRKARLLLKEGKAKIYQYNPFTIQLCYATGEYMQECHIGIDTGSEHIGIAVTSEEKVLFKGEVELRQDVKSNLDTRRSYRRDRRNRKTRYRKARFLNRKKKESWLPPSIENRVNHTFKWINKLIALLPNPKLHIEVGKFDVAKMINPDIQGVDYQHGQTYGFYDMRYFVFARDNYTCQCCGKSKGKILQTHHIIYRSNGGSNRADNLITVCTDCHTYENHQKGGILYQWQEKHKKTKQYKEPSFMNVLRKRIFKKYPNAVITYGSETTPKRKELGLEKMHYNDAIIISGISTIKENPNEWLLIKQFRKKKRSLHEATARKGRKEPNRLQKRNAKNKPYYKGFYLNDKVEVFGRIGYITGFTSGGAHIKNAENEYIILPNKSYKQVGISNIKLLHHNNNWQYVNKRIS
ncbi:RNA-guided endonuclease IscB [Enterococcus cecorum]|uniref:RNA-guided endonuclease IscB n=1 Tax=Enterococcus cecorum TaxID=44008 RepID=UPI00249273F5|nr:RNA-guided endonuclease IscB [Enterococcus cecorum]